MSIGERVLGTRSTSPELWVRHRAVDPDLDLGSLHSATITVVADDGVPLHAEIDEFVPEVTGGRRAKHAAAPPATLVFIHGYSLHLDCWHFQRAAFRGAAKAVYYDPRSHGRSGRSPLARTIAQLSQDKRLLDPYARRPGRAWSLMGLTRSFAEQHLELPGDQGHRCPDVDDCGV